MRLLKPILLTIILTSALYSAWRWAIAPAVLSQSKQDSITLVSPPSDIKYTLTDAENNASCLEFSEATSIDRDGQLRLLSWNIYKQQNSGWERELTEQIKRAELAVLQEVSLAPSFIRWLSDQSWMGQQASAFEVFDKSSGVFNLSKVLPKSVCAIFETEPWLQLPKSALFAAYTLSNGQQLWVANIHAVNFTLGTEDIEQQLTEIEQALKEHSGPVIFAGDFNSWSEPRLEKVLQAMQRLGLQEVPFNPDHRTEFPLTGQPLDHIFYRGLELKKAEVVVTSASDHQPLWAEFHLLER